MIYYVQTYNASLARELAGNGANENLLVNIIRLFSRSRKILQSMKASKYYSVFPCFTIDGYSKCSFYIYLTFRRLEIDENVILRISKIVAGTSRVYSKGTGVQFV